MGHRAALQYECMRGMSALEQVIRDFQGADDEMRVEFLLEYAEALPPLPRAYYPLRDAGMHLIEECQSPVFLVVGVRDGRVSVVADVPHEAPVARSFVALLVYMFDEQPTQMVVDAPRDLLKPLGIAGLLGLRRRYGLRAIYNHLRQEVKRRID